MLRQSMVAAANFGQLKSFQAVTVPLDQVDCSGLNSETIGELSRRMTVYMSQREQDMLPIVIDSGASKSLTPNLQDFVGPIQPAEISSLNGLSGTTAVRGFGTVQWMVRDVMGVARTIKTKAYYVPEASIRLFSPQTFFQEQQAGKLVLDHKKTQLQIPDGTWLEFPYNSSSNLPFMLTGNVNHMGLTFEDATMLGDGYSVKSALSTANHSGLMNVADETNQNLTASQKELLLWHWKLGHANMQWIQTLCRDPKANSRRLVLETKEAKTTSCVIPLCAACMLGKQHRRTPHSNHGGLVDGKDSMLKREHLQPGDCVSIDQYESTIRGRLPHTYGKERTEEQYRGGTLFVDHASGMIFLANQVSLRVGETISSKKKFERFADEYGVKIREYRADNAPFGREEFLNHVHGNGQRISFSGVGAHHQNGVAERAVKTTMSWARTMLLHATIHWPEQMHLHLWPFAVEHAVWLWNHLPNRRTNIAPLEIFSGITFSDFHHLQRSHVWGCPVYVLDPKLQDGKKLPKWQAKARRGQFLGISPDHSTTVGRILNLRSGFISSQYHVVYDDLFSTVPNADSGGLLDEPNLNGDFWQRLLAAGTESNLPDEDDDDGTLELGDEWMTDSEIAERHARRQSRPPRPLPTPPLPIVPVPPSVDGGRGRATRNHVRFQPPLEQPTERGQEPEPPAEPGELPSQDQTGGLLPPEGASNGELLPPEGEADEAEHEIVFEDDSDDDSTTRQEEIERRNRHFAEPDPESHGRGKRERRPNRHLFDERLWASTAYFPRGSTRPKQKVRRELLNAQFLQSLTWDTLTSAIASKSKDLLAMDLWLDRHTDPDTRWIEEMHPMALATKADAADNPSWEQAMNGPDKDGYWEACKKEYNTLHEKMKAWEVVARETWMNVLPGTWAFKCKRYPDGSVRKLKARFCARGDKQVEGVDFFDTFAPVVNWTTVRLMMILSIILNLSTVQVDYTAAFVHAPIDKDPNWDKMTEAEQKKSGVYVEMPRGFAQPGKVLKLTRSLYGLKQAPRNFFLHLKSKLEQVGLKSQEHIDPCLFMSDKIIVLVYVDDTLIYSPKREWIDEFLGKLQNQQNVTLEIEDSVAGFLGVHIERNDSDGTITLTQKGLIKRIVEALQLGDKPMKRTPASKDPLVANKNGTPAQCKFSYPSVIGMLQYLQAHSRPDITYAVSQCARYTHDPKTTHEEALERIGQYLKGTMEKGLILRPTYDNLNVDCYVDADFAGLWPHEDKMDPSCVKSRTGFAICIANCPVIWQSKLQSDIATSTMEAEYTALSVAMKSVLPLLDLLKTVARGVGMTEDQRTKFKTTVWEDNNGALTLANMEPGRFTPRSKFYAIRMHWFRSHLKPNRVTVEKIETSKQRADIMTKGLTKDTFETIRKLLCGW